jgi:hypothetical protein
MSVHKLFIFLTLDTHCYVKHKVHDGLSVKLPWPNIKYRAAVNSLLPCWQQTTRLARQKEGHTDHTGHQDYFETLSMATGVMQKEMFLTDFMVAVNCRNWGKPQNMKIYIGGNSKQGARSTFQNQIAWGDRNVRRGLRKTTENLTQDNRFLRFEAQKSLGRLLIFSLLKF